MAHRQEHSRESQNKTISENIKTAQVKTKRRNEKKNKSLLRFTTSREKRFANEALYWINFTSTFFVALVHAAWLASELEGQRNRTKNTNKNENTKNSKKKTNKNKNTKNSKKNTKNSENK